MVWMVSVETCMTYLIDDCLNGDDGLKLLDEHRKMKIPSPAIVLTGMGDNRIDFEAMKRGAVDYLIKDEITPALLERSIRCAIEHARILKELERRQEEIKASELCFRSVVQSASDGIFIADADSESCSATKAQRSFWATGKTKSLDVHSMA
jgi:FixJ family two-component response regulator